MSRFATHLESSIDGSVHPHDRPQTVHEGRPLLVRYDLERVGRSVSREAIALREPTLWRYRELLPIERDENVTTLGERVTPLLACPRLGAALGVPRLAIKDESQLPTGSFKSRGMALAVSRAKELGIERVAVPTAGNAGGALAAYAARAGLRALVAMPRDTPEVNRREAALFGAEVVLVDGLITDCAAVVAERAAREGWFDCSTLKEPYRLEGKKTMGIELAEQLGWRLPDAILYPTGGGTGLVGMWKAFDELAALGWIDPERRPRMYACQSDGCAPIADAFEAGERFAAPVASPSTRASGLRVPRAVGDFLILDAVRASGGRALRAPEGELSRMLGRAARAEGISICPETAIALLALEELAGAGEIGAGEEVVVFNTGAAQKYVHLLPG